MGERVYIMYKLKDTVTRRQYANWLKEEHYPWGRTLPTTKCVEGYFVTADFDTTASKLQWDCIAVIDMEDREAWLKGLADEQGQYQWEKWLSFVSDWKIFYSEHIDA
ncbi:MAG: hypothetical protein EPO21_01485 [Chloroflexota bacterium]|nr:MAG: hypothetical protein EPO21_01485 [Chloroflexota bacterium]